MADISTLLDTISVYQTQYDQVDKLWNYFSVVTLAMVGFVIGNDKATRTLKEPLAIVAVYWVFCIGNHAALITGQEQLEQLGTMVTNQVAILMDASKIEDSKISSISEKSAPIADQDPSVGEQAKSITSIMSDVNAKAFLPLGTQDIKWFHLGVIAAISLGVMAVAYLRMQSRKAGT